MKTHAIKLDVFDFQGAIRGLLNETCKYMGEFENLVSSLSHLYVLEMFTQRAFYSAVRTIQAFFFNGTVQGLIFFFFFRWV